MFCFDVNDLKKNPITIFNNPIILIGFSYFYDRIQMNKRQQEILSIIQKQQPISISEIGNILTESISIPTLNRALSSLN